jgi:hypothetical protein
VWQVDEREEELAKQRIEMNRLRTERDSLARNAAEKQVPNKRAPAAAANHNTTRRVPWAALLTSRHKRSKLYYRRIR